MEIKQNKLKLQFTFLCASDGNIHDNVIKQIRTSCWELVKYIYLSNKCTSDFMKATDLREISSCIFM